MTKISTPGIIFFMVVLAAVFLVGRQFSGHLTSSAASADIPSTAVFNPKKSDKPEVKFFVMSFCSYGNQIEASLRPVFDLLNSQVNFTPHYIFEKIENLDQFCQSRTGDIKDCDNYIKKNYYQSQAECQKSIADNRANCLNEKNYLKTSNGALYGSLGGRQEANENVRELCAWNQVGGNKQAWWNFIENVNQNCTVQNGDTCWEQQGKAAGLDTDKITECFNKDTVDLIEKEIAAAAQYHVQVSPTVLVNDVAFPPENSYASANKGTLKINSTTIITQDKYRSSESLKIAVCASFNNAPKNCQTKLDDTSDPASNIIGCKS